MDEMVARTRLTANRDGVGNKPWIDDTQHLAATSFYEKVDEWYPTWGPGNDRGMTIKSVKMWQEKGHNGC